MIKMVMKKNISLLSLFGFVFLLSCHTAKINGQTPEAGQTPVVQPTPPLFVIWDKKSVELGPVKKGELRTLFYEFTNTSGEPVQIDIVDACDCTKVDYPRRVIAPNEKCRLDVTFNSAEKDAAETISINVIFKNTHPNGVPRIEIVEYKFELIK
jgi:hypothetical protein